MAKKNKLKKINEIKPGTKPAKEMLAAVMSAKADLSKYSSFMSAKENPNKILKNTADGKKKGYELFREMMTDPQIQSDLGTRQKMVSGLPWKIIVPNGTEQDNANANLLEEMLRPVYEDLITEAQDDQVGGFSVTELNWTYDEGRLTLPSVLGHKQEDFNFSPEWELLLKTDSKDVPVSRDRVCLSVFNKKKGNLFGESLLTAAFWPWWFKRHAWVFWSTFLEKFGQPTVIGYFPPGTPVEEQNKLLEACQSVQNEMSVILPENWKIALLEASRSGAVDTYEKFLEFCDRSISKVILHTVMTSNATKYGTQSLGEVQQDLTAQVVEADARRYSWTITQQVVIPLARYNFNFTVPPLFMIVYQTEDTSKESAERDKILSETVPVAADDIYDKYGLSKPGPDTIVTFGEFVGKYSDLLKLNEAKLSTPALPKTTGVTQTAAFAEADTEADEMDLVIVGENDYLEGMYDLNEPLLRSTFDLPQTKKILNKSKGYEDALINIDKYRSNSAATWEQFLLLARVLGEYSVRLQIKAAEAEEESGFAEPERSLVEYGPGDTFHYGNPKDAIAWFKKKISVPTDVWEQLEGDARSAAFYVSEVEDLRWIEYCKNKMLEALEKGKTFQQYKKELFEISGADPFHGYMRTAFNTNIFSALSVQSEKALLRVADRFPYWRYSAVLDGKTRPSHAAMHDYVARYDDPVWSIWTPPNGFNCRCRKVICTPSRYELLKNAYEVSGKNINDYFPDKGFAINPANASPEALMNKVSKNLKVDLLNLNTTIREKLREKKNEG